MDQLKQLCRAVRICLRLLIFLRELFQTVKPLLIQDGLAIFVFIAHGPVERQPGDGGGHLNADGPQGVLVLLQGFHQLPADAPALARRIHEDAEEAALILPVPVGADGAAAQNPASVLGHVEMGPGGPLRHIFRRVPLHQLVDHICRIVRSVRNLQGFPDQGGYGLGIGLRESSD